jgi:hypothetical protein
VSAFEDAVIQRIKQLEREVERLQKWERPIVITDHGSLSGLADDDHTQYTKHPVSSADNAIARWDGTDGDKLQNSVIKIDDNGKFSGDALDGWIYDTDTWTYVSATSFKITGKNVAYRFPKGTKIKLVQSGSTKYFYVIATAYSTDTTITITGGSDYNLANATISGQAYSYAAAPQNFPKRFAYTPIVTYAGGTTDPTSITTTFHFSINGSLVSVIGDGYLTRGSGNRTYTAFTLPFIFGGGTGSFSCQYADTVKQVFCAGDKTKVTTYHTAMISDGYYWLYFAGLLT